MIRRRPTHLVSRKLAAAFGAGIAVVSVVLVAPLFRFSGSVAEGDIASRTLEAAHPAQYQSEALTAAARAEAAATVEDVALPVDPAIAQAQSALLVRYFAQVRGINARTDISTQQKLDQIALLTTPAPVSNAARLYLQGLAPSDLTLFEQRARDGLETILAGPVGRGETPDAQRADIEASVGQFLLLPENAALLQGEASALASVIRAFAVPTFVVDEEATEAQRAAASAAVAPVVRTLTAGQVIVNEGQAITAQDIEALRQTGVIDDGLDLSRTAGGALAALGFGVLMSAVLYLAQPFADSAARRTLAVGLMVCAGLVVVRIVVPLVTPDTDAHMLAFALPLAAVGMVAASFADLSFAAVIALATSLFAALVAGVAPQIAGSSYVGSLQALELALAYSAGGLAGAVLVYRAERLGRFLAAGIAAGLATGTVMAAFWLISVPREDIELAWIALAAAIHGFGAAVIALGLYMALSMALGVTSRLQLLELAQAGHPLLQRLQDEAPGTYHHSMLVGALGERAAARVGADALLVRAGAYYHDIGKLAMPGHYVENMLDAAETPHDALEPGESARIIRAHVSNGLELARKYRLPAVVRSFIPEHHGTRLVTFFYRKASSEGASPDPAGFRYAGPRPQTRETAIVMLADSCEAVVRARRDDAGTSIDDLVDGVIAERLSEGQLDECDITMRDLQAVAASFKATLRAVYHPRIQYPEPTADEIETLARGESPARP